MPRPSLYAVSSDLGLSKTQQAKLVTYAAMDDILGQNRPRHLWTHPCLARQLGTDPVFLHLVQSYLEYRHTRGVSGTRGIRPHRYGAQIYELQTGMPLDLVTLPSTRDEKVRLTGLLREGAVRKVRVGGEFTANAEKTIMRACLVTSWEQLADTYFSQRAAQMKEYKAA